MGNLLCVNDDDSLIVRHIEENTPENAIVFLTGIGKCYPLLRSHKVLNNLSQSLAACRWCCSSPARMMNNP